MKINAFMIYNTVYGNIMHPCDNNRDFEIMPFEYNRAFIFQTLKSPMSGLHPRLALDLGTEGDNLGP